MYVGFYQGRRYYLAASLVDLFGECDARWPNRDRKTDGWIGDASHQARESDHNPDWDDNGVVRAVDIDKDGLDVAELLDALTGDPRVEYVIHNRRMMRSYAKTIDGHTYKPWQWAPYDGDNAHTGHVHVSIKRTHAAETNTSAWFKAAQPEEFELSNAQYTAIMAELKAVRRDVRDYALWEVLYDLETDDERLAAEAAFDDAREAGKSVTDAKVAAMRALNPLVQGIKEAQKK